MLANSQNMILETPTIHIYYVSQIGYITKASECQPLQMAKIAFSLNQTIIHLHRRKWTLRHSIFFLLKHDNTFAIQLRVDFGICNPKRIAAAWRPHGNHMAHGSCHLHPPLLPWSPDLFCAFSVFSKINQFEINSTMSNSLLLFIF